MLSDDQTKAARWLDEVRQYLTAAADSSMSRNNSEQLAYELLEALPANALEAQAREIAELKAQESELCTLYGLAQAECKKLRAEAEGLRKDAERYAWLKSRPIDWSIEHHRNGWATTYARNELDAAIDKAMKAQP